MKDHRAEHRLEVESVTTSPLGDDRIVVCIEGRWEGRKRPLVDEAVLMVENEGRRHRFPAIPQEGKPRRIKRHEPWSGSFDLPVWLEPVLEGRTSLKLGDGTVDLPAESFPAIDSGAATRAELERLRRELAGREAAEQAALSEAAALRAQLERLADELAAVRTKALAQGGADQAQELLARARELRRMLGAAVDGRPGASQPPTPEPPPDDQTEQPT